MTRSKLQDAPGKRVVTLLLILFGILILFGACGRKRSGVAETVTDASGNQLIRLRTWSRLDCSAAPFVIGDRAGIFREAGLEIVYTGEVSSAQRLATVLSGDNDIYGGHPSLLLVAIEGGAPVIGIATGDHEPGWEVQDPDLEHMWWVSHVEGPLKTPEDIKNFPGVIKMQSISRNQCQEFMTSILLDRIGAPKDKIEYILLPDIEGIQSLKMKLVDMTTPHPPFFKATEETGVANILISSRGIAGLEGGTTLFAFTKEFIQNNPEAVKRFVYAIKKAERFNNDNPEVSARWTEEAIGVPVRANHWHSREAKIDDAGLQYWLEGSKKYGLLPADSKLTLDDLRTHEFEAYGAEDYVLTFDDRGNVTLPFKVASAR
jgi:ABC-type nitrate/sulfonate/bicarbonate transport system substrate-binding protein